MPGFEELAEHVAARIDAMGTPVDVVKPVIGSRASGEPYVRLGKAHIGGHDCVVLGSGPGTLEMLSRLFMILGYMAGRRARRVALGTGYFPLSRSDKDEGELELALVSHIVHLIRSASYGHLDRIIAADLHAPQVVTTGTMGLITEVSLARRVLKRAVEDALKESDNVCLLFPDEGAQKRFEAVVEHVIEDLGVNIPTVCGLKRRKSSKLSQMKGLHGDVEGLRNALVVSLDDEAATMGTNNQIAHSIKENYGARKFWAVVVHGVLCGKAPEILGAADSDIDKTYCMDTIPVNNRAELKPLVDSGRLMIVEWAEDLADIIYHHHWDESIRQIR